MPEPRYVLDHVGISVRDVAASRAFYERALAPLGFSVMMEVPGFPGAGFGLAGHYYAAFVVDPDGNNVEAVCHTPEA